MTKRKKHVRPNEVMFHITRVRASREALTNMMSDINGFCIIEKVSHPYGPLGWANVSFDAQFAGPAREALVSLGFGVEVACGSATQPPQQQPPPPQPPQQQPQQSQKSPFFHQECPKLAGGDARTDGSHRSSVDSQYGPSLRPQTEGSWGTLQQSQGAGTITRCFLPPYQEHLRRQQFIRQQPPLGQGQMQMSPQVGRSIEKDVVCPSTTLKPVARPTQPQPHNYPENRGGRPARHLDEAYQRPASNISEKVVFSQAEAVARGEMVFSDNEESSPSNGDKRGYDQNRGDRDSHKREDKGRQRDSREREPFDRHSGYQQPGLVHSRPDIADEEEIWRQRRRQQSDEMMMAVERVRQRREEEEKRYKEREKSDKQSNSEEKPDNVNGVEMTGNNDLPWTSRAQQTGSCDLLNKSPCS